MAPPWTHLIRFLAEEDGHIHLGQVDANVPDVGIAAFEGTPISAKLIEGSLYDGVVSDTIMTVKQVGPKQLCLSNAVILIQNSSYHRSRLTKRASFVASASITAIMLKRQICLFQKSRSSSSSLRMH